MSKMFRSLFVFVVVMVAILSNTISAKAQYIVEPFRGHENPRIDMPCQSPLFDIGRTVEDRAVTGVRYVKCVPAAIVAAPEHPHTSVTITQDPSPVVTPIPCTHGNPGNKKCKGNAGENPNGRGTMDNDSSDGNGQHGNQGKGGEHKKK